MKVLWITNIVFQEASALLNGDCDFRGSGGWMQASAKALIKEGSIELYVATVSTLINKLTILQGESITYYLLPYGKGYMKYNPEYESMWKKVKEDVNPDIVHIHGTEYSHGLAYINACGSKNVVISIQGLLSECCKHFCDGISRHDILRNITLFDILKGTCFHDRKLMIKRSENEIEAISKVQHIIGRTSWDRSHIWAINPNVVYHFCNETLQDEFYSGIWSYENCTPHSIFLSQAPYPIKGAHQVLKAMPLVLQYYPDAQIRIAGPKFIYGETGRHRSYHKYLQSLIKKNGVSDKVFLCGALSPEEMKREYLNSNLFIIPSSIENSPNSLGEAQILGVPCLASYVGGIPDMMKGNEDNLYRFDDIEMLANKICSIFENSVVQEKMRTIAFNRHSPENNNHRLMEIYKEINKM